MSESIDEAIARVRRENDAILREMLKVKFSVPEEFMETAVAIWWDGKED